MTFGHSIVIARDIDEVFAVAGNPDHDPLWGGLVIKSRQISAGPLGTGTTLEQTATIMGARFVTLIEITEYEPNRITSFKSEAPVRLTHRRGFEPVPGGTRLTFAVEVDTQGKFTIAESLLKSIAQRRVESDLSALKDFIETGCAAGAME